MRLVSVILFLPIVFTSGCLAQKNESLLRFIEQRPSYRLINTDGEIVERVYYYDGSYMFLIADLATIYTRCENVISAVCYENEIYAPWYIPTGELLLGETWHYKGYNFGIALTGDQTCNGQVVSDFTIIVSYGGEIRREFVWSRECGVSVVRSYINQHVVRELSVSEAGLFAE